MAENLISVIIPAYNAAKYIKNTVESVLKQTYQNFEIIIVDDASSDNTVEVVNSIKDERIKLIRHARNQGPGAARNTALDAAKGEYVTFLDSDDEWLPQRLEKMLEIVLEAGSSYFVADDLWLCFETPNGLKPWKKQLQFKKKVAYLDFTLSDFIKREIGIFPIIPIGHIKQHCIKFETSCFYGEDTEFICHLFRTGLKLRLISEAYYLYRITPGSLTSRNDRYEHLIKVYERLLAYDDFGDEERKLFSYYIDKFNSEHIYNIFASNLKKGDILNSLNFSFRHPKVFFEFIKRSPKSMHYRLNAWLAKGRIR